MDFTFLSHPLSIIIILFIIIDLYIFGLNRYIQKMSRHIGQPVDIIYPTIVMPARHKLNTALQMVASALVIISLFVLGWKEALFFVAVKFLSKAIIPLPYKTLYPHATKVFKILKGEQ